MGLGYDSATDDYKVVLVVPESTWIFELRSNSWRRIDVEFRPDFGAAWSFSAFSAHGLIYWFHRTREIIYAFDVTNEKFSKVRMPPVAGSIQDLYVVKDCLCACYFYGEAGEVHLYLRNKHGDDYTWSRLRSMQLLSLDIEHFNYARIVGYLEEGYKILLDIGFLDEWNQVERKCMISYDLGEELLSKVDFPAEEYALGWEPRMFNPSFVPITGAWKPLKEELYDEE